MSILIKGMKMPKCCDECDFVQYGIKGDWCYITEQDLPCICPLIALPDHGDLIDRDEIFMQLRTDCAVIERMASEARAMAKDYLDGEKTGMGKAMIRVYEHESIISAERSEDDGNK